MKSFENRISIFLAPFILFFSLSANAEVLTASHLIGDLNPGSDGSFPSNFVTFSSALYFSATTAAQGRELWKFDGTSILLTSNINDTVTDVGGGLFVGNSSSPLGFAEFRNRIYFSAYEPRRGDELWSYDGTNAFRAADINADADDTIKSNPRNSFPTELTVFNDQLYFSADNGGNKTDYELWRYDGTNASIVTNLNGSNNGSSFPSGLTVFQNALYFMADDGNHGYELWKYTGAQMTLLDINPGGGNSSSYPKNFTPLNGKLYFQAYHPTYGFELWQTDGTNVALAADILSGTSSSTPEFLTPFQQAIYFRASDSLHGSELWKFNGTNATLVADINPTGDSFPKNLTVFNNQLFFAATDGANGWELWKYDGTNATLVTNLNPTSDSFPEHLTVCDGALYFSATTPGTGYELWRYNGRTVSLVADLNPSAGSSFPLNLKAHNNQLFFSAAQNGASDYELWNLTTAPLHIRSLQALPGGAQVFWDTLGGTTNVIQASGNVEGPYTNVSSPIAISGVTITTTNFTEPGATDGEKRFYRVVQQ